MEYCNMRCVTVRLSLLLIIATIMSAIKSSFVIDVGSRGLTGLAGPMGPQGWIGPTGLQGKSGQRGSDGLIGVPGIMGPIGAKGLQGPMGQEGQEGARGKKGFCPPKVKRDTISCKYGKVGPEGIRGEMGESGVIGRRGKQGKKGAKGSKGIKGGRGAPGNTGSPGMLTAIQCREKTSRYTRPNKFRRGKHKIGCSEKKNEFLQGFSIEPKGAKIRYRYRCCRFEKMF